MTHAANSINYIEFPAVDLAGIKQFYGAVFGWSFVDYGPTYASFEGAGVDGGFTTDSGAAERGGVLIVLYHPDLAAVEVRVRDHGGEVTRPVFEFPGGRRFHFRDPDGNELAVWSE